MNPEMAHDQHSIIGQSTLHTLPLTVIMSKWSPNVSYSKSLADVRNQLTPAEAFRQELRSQGKETRQLLKNERVWRRPEFSRAIVRIQACYRGYRLRRTLSLVILQKERERREFSKSMLQLFHKGDFAAIVAAVEGRDIAGAAAEDTSLTELYAKSLYSIGRYDSCSESCLRLLERDAGSIKIRYMLASCYVQIQRYEAAFTELTNLIGLDSESLQDSVFKLHAMVCTRVRPHRYALAVTDYDYLIALNAYDMNLVSILMIIHRHQAHFYPQYLEQAYLLVSLQEYDLALDNLTHILKYESNSVAALCFR